MGSHARVVVAGTSGDSGKTLVSLGLVAAWRRVGRRVAAFKKGPDYIDAAWLGWAAERQARNLDVFLMGEDTVKGNLAWHARDADLTLIEGNRGLYDGLDAAGSASTARLAALVQAPVVLVLSAAKMTATAAAMDRRRHCQPGLKPAPRSNCSRCHRSFKQRPGPRGCAPAGRRASAQPAPRPRPAHRTG
jgi:cobyrinic acid a,c-diamide synthase